jgi:hypothetical protein
MQLSKVELLLPAGLFDSPLRLQSAICILHYSLGFQVVAHTYIAVNRYTAIVHPFAHERVTFSQTDPADQTWALTQGWASLESGPIPI